MDITVNNGLLVAGNLKSAIDQTGDSRFFVGYNSKISRSQRIIPAAAALYFPPGGF